MTPSLEEDSFHSYNVDSVLPAYRDSFSMCLDVLYLQPDPLPQAETYDDSETAGDDPADNVVTVTGDGEESTDNDIGAVPKRAKKPVVTQAKSKNKTPDNEGGTVINIALPEDISEEQELKIAALVEDKEMLYNQTTKELKKPRQRQTGGSQILGRQLV
ncbi:unnamed protein product [Mytilus coruscus]|uniref:Uncharacterized protein n=1 Tax=Mytilus coruscus TaxID=42192 RepID=A0A6J8CC29_MYTCO|nr:unnamed protein product [Mytilus coruscus]